MLSSPAGRDGRFRKKKINNMRSALQTVFAVAGYARCGTLQKFCLNCAVTASPYFRRLMMGWQGTVCSVNVLDTLTCLNIFGSMHCKRAGANASKGLTPTDPPVFDPSQDIFERRRNIARWVYKISTAASKGSDRLYKTIFATLANHLYDRGFPSTQKSIVDEAQTKGLIN